MTITAEPTITEQTAADAEQTADNPATDPETALPSNATERALPGTYKWLLLTQVIVNEHNIRDDAAAIPGIVQNLVEDGPIGLIQPITVAPLLPREIAESTPIAEQTFVIVEGEQRYWSAQEAGHTDIQAIIRWDYAGERAQRIVMLRQVHRKDPTAAQQARGIAQLALEGMSDDEIATAIGFQPEQVRAGRAVAALNPAMADRVRNSGLDLIQQAMLAEFQDQGDRVVGKLVDAAAKSPHEFARTVEYERNEKATREKIAARRAELTAAGITLLTTQPSSYESKDIRPVRELRNADGPLTVEAHTGCPGHRAFLSSWGSEEHYCAGWRGHGHKVITAARTGGMSEQEKADRRRIIANNKAMEAANPVRRSKFLAPLFAGKTAPKDTAQFLAEIHDRDPGALGALASAEGRTMYAELVHPGKRRKPGSRNVPTRLADARYQILTLASVAAAIECRITRESWRHKDATVALWLSFCVHNGYDPDDVERLIIDAHPAPAWNSAPRRRKAATAEPAALTDVPTNTAPPAAVPPIETVAIEPAHQDDDPGETGEPTEISEPPSPTTTADELLALAELVTTMHPSSLADNADDTVPAAA